MNSLLELLTVLCLASSLPKILAQTHTYPQLVERMTGMSGLAALPPVGERTSLASSYNRSSQYDAGIGKYLNWDANWDGIDYIRPERNALVLADIKGAGAISRIWSATPAAGHVSIYLDGQRRQTSSRGSSLYRLLQWQCCALQPPPSGLYFAPTGTGL